MLSKISLAFRYPEEMFSKRRGNLACHWTNDLKFIYLWSSQNHKTRGRIFIILDFCICIYWPFCSPILCQHCCRLFVCTTWTSVIGTPAAWMVQKKINTHFLMGGDNASFSVVSIRKICFNTGIEYKMFTCRKCFKRARKNATGTTNRTSSFCTHSTI